MQVPSQYENLGEVGRGPTGVVFKARCKHSGQIVALKLLRLNGDDQDPMRVAYLFREAQAMASFGGDTEKFVPFAYSIGEDSGQWFITREFVEGCTLDEAAKSGSIDLRKRIEVLASIAKTLHRAHDRGFVHRNLSPENVLITADGTPKLVGFGHVGLLEAPVPYTPTPATDIEAIGKLLAWIMPSLKSVTGMEKVVRRCFTESERYATADEVAVDLEAVLTATGSRFRRLLSWIAG